MTFKQNTLDNPMPCDIVNSMSYHVYILANKPKGTLYVGFTGNLVKRVYEHKQKSIQSFSQKYDATSLVYAEEFTDPIDGINREKQLKKWHRSWKIALIERINPNWQDLYEML